MDRFICQAHVARVAVGIRIHRHGGDAQAAAGGDDAAGDFTAIGDQHLVEIRLAGAGASDGGVLGRVVLGHGKALCTPPWWRVEGRRRNNRCGRSLPITAHPKAASLHCTALHCTGATLCAHARGALPPAAENTPACVHAQCFVSARPTRRICITSGTRRSAWLRSAHSRRPTTPGPARGGYRPGR